MISYKSVQELVEQAQESGKGIWEIVVLDQAWQQETTAEVLYGQMADNFKIMLESIREGSELKGSSPSGMSGEWSGKLRKAMQDGKSIGGSFLTGMLIKALSVAQCNSRMGRIVAAPTAGSCGILPAVLVTAMEEKQLPERDVVNSLFTAAGFGMVIAARATVSGAEGGCQAECGSASAMAAAALVELLGGSPQQAADACAIALKNMLGLVCDPVAGLVEIPCIKRNAMGAANALVAAELALAGIESVIPADEVIDAMKEIGDAMSVNFKETAKGGLAASPTAQRLAERILGNEGSGT